MKARSWSAWIGRALCLMILLAWGAIGTGSEPGQPVARAASEQFDCADQSEIPQAECEALVIFYNQTNGPGWQNNDGWLVTNTPCTWSGITCAAGHVTVLNKNGGGDAGPRLVGTIPAELANLTELDEIDLRDNELTGPIPPQLGSLSKLRFLDFSDNQLSGPIPPELGNLSNLINLHLDFNQLSGTIPPQLGNLTKLVRLNLQYNQLSGVLPPSLGNMTSLGFVFFTRNNLFGNIPPEFANLTNLEWLRISDNPAMQGELPLGLKNLTKMHEFWISQTQMCVPIEQSFLDWFNNIPVRYGDVCNLDLSASRLEVIQSVQDLDQSVRLVANKRTFVRFYATSNAGNHATNATLLAERNGQSANVYALARVVRPVPVRDILEHTFLFELPAGFREGQVKLTANLNPYKVPGEVNYANNSTSTTVNFEVVPSPNVVVNIVTYRIGTTTHTTPRFDGYQMIDWVTRAFPVPSVNAWYNNYDWNAVTGDETGLPSCDRLNTLMALGKIFEAIFIGKYPSNTRFYGLITDTGGFARGLATDIPGAVACGPTGVPGNPNSAGASNGGWDTDGTYGDWYGAHELAHAYGRSHVRGAVPSLGSGQCGDEAGFDAGYPHAQGRISTATTGNTALFGFDSKRQVLYPPTWTDVMTYCRQEWISDYTFEGLMSFFQSNTAVAAATLPQQGATKRLLVSGSIDPVTLYVDLLPLYVIPDAGEVEERIPGPYAIVLRDGEDDELARYPFTPDHADAGPVGQNQPAAAESHDNSKLMISELVPFITGTVQVQIEGEGGALLKSVNVSANPPTVTITAPNGGETLDGDPITVSWTASDPDGDELSFIVQYSQDNGATWTVVAPNVLGNSVELPANNIPGSDQGLFRVWASDGVNTASDSSDASFVVPNHPPTVEIIEPVSGTVIAVGQTLYLEAFAYDVEGGTMAPAQVQWASSLDGVLGQGAQLPVASLTAGLHTLTVTADDGASGVASASVQVTVVATEGELPQVADALQANPTAIHFSPASNQISETVMVQNQNAANAAPLRWEAAGSDEWVQLSNVTGTVPGALTLTFNDTGLGTGQYTATVTLTSPDIPEQTLQLQVTVGEPEAASTPDDALQVATTQLSFNPASGEISRTLTIGNQNDSVIRWNATSSEAWLQLSATSGFTGDALTIAFNNMGLADGEHTATVTLTSPDVPEQTLEIEVSVQIGKPKIYLPQLNFND